MEHDELINAILSGGFDADLDEIAEAARERRKTLERARARTIKSALREGMRVRIRPDANLRPAYILGAYAKVVSTGRRGRRITVELEQDAGRFRAGDPIGCPADCLEIV